MHFREPSMVVGSCLLIQTVGSVDFLVRNKLAWSK